MRDAIAKSVSVCRTAWNVIEYTVTEGDGFERTYHANRVATFHGRYTGAPATQLCGAARTLWRETDAMMRTVFAHVYPGAEITIA